MTPRPATLADMPAILDRLRLFHGQAQMAAPFIAPAAEELCAGLIQSPVGVVLIHPAGIIGGALVPLWFNPSQTLAVELFWHAERHGLKLLRGFEEWAKLQGASEIRMTSEAALPRADKILRARGYRANEISYSKEA